MSSGRDTVIVMRAYLVLSCMKSNTVNPDLLSISLQGIDLCMAPFFISRQCSYF